MERTADVALLPRPKPALPVAVLLAVVAAVSLTSCGSDSGKTSGSAASSGQKLAITIKGDAVTPKNTRVQVKLNKPLIITITSDRRGELHVHSSPEQHLEFGSGTTTKNITPKVPGVVELEEHKSNTLIAQLEVR
ncbi:MAG: hypothetical protein ABI873_08510 [Marmoricola sp.]